MEITKIKNMLEAEQLNMSEAEQLNMIYEDVDSIRYIENPTEKVQLEVIAYDGNLIQYIKNPTEKVQLEVIAYGGHLIQYIKNPTEKVQLEAIYEEAENLLNIKNPTEKAELQAVKKYGELIKYIKYPSVEMMEMAIRQDPYNIQYIKNPIKYFQLIAIRENDLVIETLLNMDIEIDEEVQMEAIKQNPRNIRFIKDSTEDVQIEAIKNSDTAILYINKPSKKAQIEAIRQDVYNVNYINNFFIDTEIAFKLTNGFFLIEDNYDNFSYSIIDKEYNLLDGGEIDAGVDENIENNIHKIFKEADIESLDIVDFADVDILKDKVEQKENQKIENLKKHKDTINIYDPDLDMKHKDIINIIENYIETIFLENDINDIKIKEIQFYGSRANGTNKNNSDFDVIVEYEGDIREYNLFNILNEENFKINDINIDINPIRQQESGNIDEYIELLNTYLLEDSRFKLIHSAAAEIDSSDRDKNIVFEIEGGFVSISKTDTDFNYEVYDENKNICQRGIYSSQDSLESKVGAILDMAMTSYKNVIKTIDYNEFHNNEISQEMIDTLIKHGALETSEGNWVFDKEEIEKIIKVELTKENFLDLVDGFIKSENILDLEYNEETMELDVIFGLEYFEDLQKEDLDIREFDVISKFKESSWEDR